MDQIETCLAALGLDDVAQVDYVSSLFDEDELTREERIDVILGLTEGRDEAATRHDIEELSRLFEAKKSQQDDRQSAVPKPIIRTALRSPSPPHQSAPSKEPPRELTQEEKAQRERVLKMYGHVEDGLGLSEPAVGFHNTNVADVKAAEAAKCEAAAKTFAAKKQKDKQDLEKQRGDLLKRKEEARKRAARSERKA